MSCTVLMFCLSYTLKEIYSSVMEGHFPLSSKREIKRDQFILVEYQFTCTERCTLAFRLHVCASLLTLLQPHRLKAQEMVKVLVNESNYIDTKGLPYSRLEVHVQIYFWGQGQYRFRTNQKEKGWIQSLCYLGILKFTQG